MSGISATKSVSLIKINWQPALLNDLNSHDRTNWETASWSNGDPFNCVWQYDNISFKNGIMTITVDNAGCPEQCEGKPYASGEYRSAQESYGYGYYEVRMKAAKGSGLVSSFFLYHEAQGRASHDEIVFEFLGKDCRQVQTNYFNQGRGNHEQMVSLGFDACQDFHNYGFEWAKDHVDWYVDGQKVRTVSGSPASLPSRPSKIMINLWPTIGMDQWSGKFNYPGSPVAAQYDWIKYSPLDKTVATPQAPEKPAQISPWVKSVTPEDTGKRGGDGSKLIRATVELTQPIPDGYSKAKFEVCTDKCWPQGGTFNVQPGDTTIITEGYLHHPLRLSKGEYALIKIHNPTTKQTIEIKFDLTIPGY